MARRRRAALPAHDAAGILLALPMLLSLAVAGCVEEDKPGSVAGPPPLVNTPTPTPSPTPTEAPSPTPTPLPTPSANRPPQGEFRYTPDIGYDGDIHIGITDTVHVNAAKFSDPDGDPLYLTVSWGDGFESHIRCGPCRLEHSYRKHGALPLRAEVTDLRSRPVIGEVQVKVE